MEDRILVGSGLRTFPVVEICSTDLTAKSIRWSVGSLILSSVCLGFHSIGREGMNKEITVQLRSQKVFPLDLDQTAFDLKDIDWHSKIYAKTTTAP